MANEAKVFAEGPQDCIVRQFTVANATALTKGSLMVETGNRTAVLHTAATLLPPLGFLTMSKEASDNVTEVGLQRTGVVKIVADGAIRTGELVMTSDTTANRVQSAPTGILSVYNGAHRILGRALENIANAGSGRIVLTLG